jgi:signal transduction histidine kinase
MPTRGDPRSVTHLDVEGQPVAVLIHDSVVLRDPRLLDDVAAAAKWAVRNVALRTQIRDQVEGVEASRRRIITAADAERVRLEQRLQQGPGRHLQRVAELITADGSALQGLSNDVDGIRTHVSELARGLHPRTLAERGLPDALGELAARSPVPVRLRVPTVRLPAATEVTLYFTCAEALANVLKYARATQVDVHVTRDEQSVTMIVADDGVGGADPRRGSGLRGLTDRVDTLGGRLDVHSPAGAGTRVEVTVPLAPEPAASKGMVGG